MATFPKTRTVKEYSSVSLTTADQTQSTEIITPVGDITGFDIDLSLTMTGAPTGAKAMNKVIKRFSVVDKEGKTILDLVGDDLAPIYQMLNSKGHQVSVPTAATSATNYRATLNLPVNLKDQPCKVQITFAPYGDLATSGWTAGVVTCKLRVWYGDAANTLRIYKRSLSIGSGDNALGIQLVDRKQTVIMGFTVGTESNINNITLSTNGAMDEYSKMPLQQLIDLEAQQFVSGHTTGLFNLFITPFVTSISQTQFNVNGAGTDTVVIYQVALN